MEKQSWTKGWPKMLAWEELFMFATGATESEKEQEEKELATKAINALCNMADILKIDPQWVSTLGDHDGIDMILEEMAKK